jgi:hypothetical protein
MKETSKVLVDAWWKTAILKKSLLGGGSGEEG